MIVKQKSYFKSFGDALSPEDATTANAAMDRVVKELRASIAKLDYSLPGLGTDLLIALGAVFGITSIFDMSSSAAVNAIHLQLYNDNNIVNRLDGPSRASVLDGSEPKEKWLAAAQTIKDDIISAGNAIKDATLGNAVRDAWNQTIDEWVYKAHQTIDPLIDTGENILLYALGGAAILGLGYIWLSRPSVTVNTR